MPFYTTKSLLGNSYLSITSFHILIIGAGYCMISSIYAGFRRIFFSFFHVVSFITLFLAFSLESGEYLGFSWRRHVVYTCFLINHQETS